MAYDSLFVVVGFPYAGYWMLAFIEVAHGNHAAL